MSADRGSASPLLVVSAHAGDFVWRAAGAIAPAAERGDRAKVVCLSYGERGESARAWREGKGLEEIKRLRQGEAEAAAAELGAEIEFLDAGDHPLRESPELVDRLVRVYREFEDVLLDITPVFERKRKAMECLPAQAHMWEYSTDLAERRGVPLKRNAGPNLGLPHDTRSEAYVRVYPQTTGVPA